MIHISGNGNQIGNTVTGNGVLAGGDIGAAAARTPRRAGVDVAVLTILDEEIRAVQAALQQMYDYRERRLRHGPLAREAWLPASGGRRIRVAAVQTFTRGTDSAAIAYRGIVEEYQPAVVLLVGIAGGVDPQIRIGDVVLSNQVIMYDARREAETGVHRRGDAQFVSAPVGHRINDFFARVPAEQLRPGGDSYQVYRGPIGSGNAVVTDARSEIRRWLHAFNEKVLAVETEAAGVAQSFHETVRHDSGPRGWLTVRGISDTADKHKGHDHHELAAQHAAEVMAMLLPYLGFDDD